MKKILAILTVMMVGMVYVSCSKNNDENKKEIVTNYKENIVGTWAVSYLNGAETDLITFNGVNMYFEANCSTRVYRGTYSVTENVISLNEQTGKYPLNIIVIQSMTESSFVGKGDEDYIGEIKGTRIK